MTPHRAIRLSVSTQAAVLGTLAATLTPVVMGPEEPSTATLAQEIDVLTVSQRAALRVAEASVPATYKVRSGDTISAIAARHGLRTVDVLAWNGLGWRTIIHPGQVIKLRPTSSAKATTATKASPTGTSSAGEKTHTVTRGDTVYAIAKKHGSTVNAILRANGIGSGAIIYPGQKLTIPGKATTTSVDGVLQKTTKLDAEQIKNAKLIIRIGRDLGVSDRGIAIALATSMVESWIRNLDYGDRDSLGLFQQRPSAGWGSASQVRDRERSIRAFYGGPGGPNRGKTAGLLDITDWERLPFTEAAQAVQRSAFPDRYGQWELQAYAWLKQYG